MTTAPEWFQAASNVSRETLERLQIYVDTLLEWRQRINLVSKGSLEDIWHRHVLDSAQLYPLLPVGTKVLVDFGSGAGFPGLVLAIMGVPEVHLIESDSRKGGFLRAAAQLAGVSVTIHTARIEAIKPWAVDVVTARAVAPLSHLLGLVEPFLQHVGAESLIMKGESVEQELTEARKKWNMVYDSISSVTNPSSVILRLKEVRRA